MAPTQWNQRDNTDEKIGKKGCPENIVNGLRIQTLNRTKKDVA